MRSGKIVEVKMEEIRLDAQELKELKRYETDLDLQKGVKIMVGLLQRQGQLQPIVLNENCTKIWRGHTRFLAAQKLGWKTIKAELISAKEWEARLHTEP